MRTSYTADFKERALQKVYSRGSRTVESVASDLNMSYHTLKNWMREEKRTPSDKSSSQRTSAPRRPQDWSASEKLQALLETHALSDQERHSWCRHQGIYPHHLERWREELERGERPADRREELRELKTQNKHLERELKRKEKALSEAAALLVLQKKYQALWEDQDD